MSEIARVLYDLGILSILLLLGVFLRKKVRFLQNLYYRLRCWEDSAA